MIQVSKAIHSQLVYTIDHHSGSEEHQLVSEHFDPEIADERLGRVNTVPLMQANLQQFDESKFDCTHSAKCEILLLHHGNRIRILIY